MVQAILLSSADLNQFPYIHAAVHGWTVHEDNKMDVSNVANFSLAR